MAHVSRKLSNAFEGALAGGGEFFQQHILEVAALLQEYKEQFLRYSFSTSTGNQCDRTQAR